MYLPPHCLVSPTPSSTRLTLKGTIILKGLHITLPVLALIGANLIPVFGVLFLGWDVGSILLLYWLESVVIGVLNIPKILSSHGRPFGKIFDSVFFSLHFGGFCAGHAMFLKEMFQVDISVAALLGLGSLSLAAGSLFLSHFISMLINFFGRGEYKNRRSREQMFVPYGRVVIMHVTILIGGILAQQFGAPVFALIVLIGIKTFIDLVAHTREHNKAQSLSTIEDGA